MNYLMYDRNDLLAMWTPAWRVDTLNRAFLRVKTQPTQEPIDIAEAAMHLRLDQFGSPLEYADQTLVEVLITVSREYIEGLTGLMLAPQTMQMTGRSFSRMMDWCVDEAIPLMTAPVTGINSISYYDGNNALQVVDPSLYELDSFNMVPRVRLTPGSAWPDTYDKANAVIIEFTGGYSPGSPITENIPKSLKQAMLLMIGHLYENREQTTQAKLEELPFGICALIERYRLRLGMA